MYKKTLVLAVTLAVAPASAMADTLFGVYAGGQVWSANNEGQYAVGSNLIDPNFEDENHSSYYIAVEHPIPLIPNIKVRENTLEVNGGYGQNDFSHRDYIFYYEIFDNDLVSFDIGVNAMDFDGTLRTGLGNSIGRQDFSVTVPTAYAAARVGIPATDLTFFADVSALSVKDSKVQDAQIGLEYRLVENLAVDINLNAGYRHSVIELDDVDEIYSDVTFKGPFVGVEVHF
ncbi:TIGR04219 family outer membrane beta-barrel protein [Idiomarina sp. HP20-50]|uniref:TIGR04219 family outer membrane beta-barrel protein n=1 Tax=Idiomarina sp. HP20-50 TaxID=3070813 RepID=UPI00294B9512|nr:TIGR04219 family outer membrane beta-barrel protein [Idiomarina sp. HP20-50]MDV6315544.1 TIGR04219 family outer membrane beta-barrel protein [Idiomarina sp. HP20-50]